MTTEKRYITNTYVHCYCSKKAEVLVGSKLFAFINPVAYPSGIALCIWLVGSNALGLDTVLIIACFALPVVLLPWWDYTKAKKYMLNARHNKTCSHKISLLVALHSGSVNGLISDFKILKDKH